MVLRRATGGDIPAIMAIERQPGYEQFVGRSPAEFHARAIVDPDYAYLVGLDDSGAVGGFGILRGLSDTMGNVALKRFVVASPGKGFGRSMLHEIIDWVFNNTQTHRFWLDHIVTNDRARHVYEQCGFLREGVMRAAYVMPTNGRRVDVAAEAGMGSLPRLESGGERDGLAERRGSGNHARQLQTTVGELILRRRRVGGKTRRRKRPFASRSRSRWAIRRGEIPVRLR